MSVAAEIDPRQMAALRAKLGPELTRDPLERVVKDASAFALREAQTGAQGLGGIPHSIRADVRGLNAQISSNHPGALPLEIGRRAGSRMPPVDALSRYGELAFVIARSIARRGVKGRFYFRKAKEKLARSEMPRLLTAGARSIEQRWGR